MASHFLAPSLLTFPHAAVQHPADHAAVQHLLFKHLCNNVAYLSSPYNPASGVCVEDSYVLNGVKWWPTLGPTIHLQPCAKGREVVDQWGLRPIFFQHRCIRFFTLQSSIRREGDSYVLNGVKWWTSGACDPRCAVAIFMGKTDPTAPMHLQQSMVGGYLFYICLCARRVAAL
eukprot:560139-Pelagomonas_calceolata.AAC.5